MREEEWAPDHNFAATLVNVWTMFGYPRGTQEDMSLRGINDMKDQLIIIVARITLWSADVMC